MNAPKDAPLTQVFVADDWLPPEIGVITDHQTDLPRIAKDVAAIAAIEARLAQIPTTHATCTGTMPGPLPGCRRVASIWSSRHRRIGR